jgi:CheY-like chemotaxis protein
VKPPEPRSRLLPSLDHVHVLVVDDNADAREIIGSTLRYCGALVTVVSSVKKAFDALSRLRPDVIVSDLAMPENDGLSFMREVRMNPTLRSVPAIAITGYDYRFRHGVVIAAGFDVVMLKPVDPPALVRAVVALLGQ